MIKSGKPAWAMQSAVCVLTVLLLNGCFFMGERFQMDEPLKIEQIEGIRRGESTKEIILASFGPPTAIARQGKKMAFPPPGDSKREGGAVESRVFFELFSPERTLEADHIVYYYDSVRLKAGGFLFIPIIGVGFHSKRVMVDRLWLLVDDTTGILEDYVFRRAE